MVYTISDEYSNYKEDNKSNATMCSTRGQLINIYIVFHCPQKEMDQVVYWWEWTELETAN